MTQNRQDSIRGITWRDRFWFYWFLLPIYPYQNRQTLCAEVITNQVWTFDQLQGIFYVVVPVRMTVVRLAEGGLLAYAPVAPTSECIRQVRELEASYGEVKYIILPTISGLEHKVFAGPFARYFPNARVYVAPEQWSFPVSLPLSWLGLPPRRTHVLPACSGDAPFAGDFDYAILEPIRLGPGTFSEVAFYHRRSQALLVTDSIVGISEQPPPIVQQDPYCLLFHARETALEAIADTPENRRKGWQRIALFALYFSASTLQTRSWPETLRLAVKSPEKSKKAYFGLYPFCWQPDWQKSFQTLRGGGRLRVAPILQTLILNRSPKEVWDWVEHIARWEFRQIIPCHFSAPLPGDGAALKNAFSFLNPISQSNRLWLEASGSLLPQEDLRVLQRIDEILVNYRITPPPKL